MTTEHRALLRIAARQMGYVHGRDRQPKPAYEGVAPQFVTALLKVIGLDGTLDYNTQRSIYRTYLEARDTGRAVASAEVPRYHFWDTIPPQEAHP